MSHDTQQNQNQNVNRADSNVMIVAITALLVLAAISVVALRGSFEASLEKDQIEVKSDGAR